MCSSSDSRFPGHDGRAREGLHRPRTHDPQLSVVVEPPAHKALVDRSTTLQRSRELGDGSALGRRRAGCPLRLSSRSGEDWDA